MTVMGDFSSDVLQYVTNKDSEHFLDETYSNFFFFLILPRLLKLLPDLKH